MSENEFNSYINFLTSNGWISKFNFTRINTGESDIMPDHYVLEKNGLDYLRERPKENNTTAFNVTINQNNVSHSPTQVGTGNILNVTHIQAINGLLTEVEACIAKANPPEETKSIITTIIQKIRDLMTSKNVQAIKNELGNLYNHIRNLTSCISIAVSITGILSSLNS